MPRNPLILAALLPLIFPGLPAWAESPGSPAAESSMRMQAMIRAPLPLAARDVLFAHARRAGLKFDVMASTFFLGRRRPVASGPAGPGLMLDRLYAALARLSADPTDYFHLPRDRVVELGERVAI